VAWVLDHRRDLEADFRAIYHLSPREALALPGPEYLALAYRVSAYQGVMNHRMAEAADKAKPRQWVRQVEGTRESVQADPLLREAISFS
jgi:hypothetical protein